MTARVRPAAAADIDAAAALLHRWMNPRVPPERWRRILDYPWRPADAEHGWLVEDGGEVVGFMATIYADRETAAGPRRFCDLGAWYLRREHRGTGIGDELLRAGMAQRGMTYATMTARRATGRRIRALGFTVLDDTRRVLRAGSGAAPLALRAASDGRWGAAETAILRDHAALAVDAFAAGPDEAPVLLVLQNKRKDGGVLYRELLHASDLDFLRAHAQGLAEALCRGEDEILAIDGRFLAGSAVGERQAIPLARWFRSPDVPAHEVDHLYSETLLLDLKLP